MMPITDSHKSQGMHAAAAPGSIGRLNRRKP